ncbi:hypothetical protein [Micromonospora chersina]|uniref:hypothetical protein n=1 Tax=Micromonospora chersina TaxID=47854 RepID=UPI0037194929
MLLAPDATWANWFDLYWLQLPAGERAAYRAVFAGLDPVDLVGRLGAGAYLQLAGADPSRPTPPTPPRSVRRRGDLRRLRRRGAAAPQAKVSVYPDEEHDLGAARTRDDRLAWLAGRLGLPA